MISVQAVHYAGTRKIRCGREIENIVIMDIQFNFTHVVSNREDSVIKERIVALMLEILWTINYKGMRSVRNMLTT